MVPVSLDDDVARHRPVEKIQLPFLGTDEFVPRARTVHQLLQDVNPFALQVPDLGRGERRNNVLRRVPQGSDFHGIEMGRTVAGVSVRLVVVAVLVRGRAEINITYSVLYFLYYNNYN